LLDAADAALYDAKHAGRNCIRWHDGESHGAPNPSPSELGRTGDHRADG
jgi:hypothetical protein